MRFFKFNYRNSKCQPFVNLLVVHIVWFSVEIVFTPLQAIDLSNRFIYKYVPKIFLKGGFFCYTKYNLTFNFVLLQVEKQPMHSETLPQWNCEYMLFDFNSNQLKHGVFYFLYIYSSVFL